MTNLLSLLFKSKKIDVKKPRKARDATTTLQTQSNYKKYEDLIVPLEQSNFGIEVKEISIIEYDRRKTPR
ncbi:MAG: hypothetical protein ACXW1P_06745 [Methylophilaceae bacterium]